MNVILRLFPYLRSYRFRIALGAVCLFLAIPCQLFHPLVWKFIVDTVIVQNRADWLSPALVVMFVVYILGTVFSASRTYILGTVGQRFIYDLRNQLYQKLQGHSIRYFQNRRHGDLISRVMNDVNALEDVIIHGIDQIIANLFSFIVVAAIIIYLHWIVGLITLIPIIIVGVLIYYFNIRVKSIYRDIRYRLGDVSSKLQENLSGMSIIKAFARDEVEARNFRRENRKYLNRSLQGVIARSIYMPSIMTIGFLSNIIMIGLGGYFVLQGSFTVGGLIAYRGYWWQLFSPIQSIAQINELYQRGIAAASRILEIIDEPLEILDSSNAIPLTTDDIDIEFKNVSFSYDDNVPVLKQISFTVRQGETIGIVGPSGSGKSTLLNLLLRFYDPKEGTILVNGKPLSTYRTHSLRERFGVVPQDPFLFNDTVCRNIDFGNLEMKLDEIENAAKSANAHTFIQELPNGYGTLLGERGLKLSGGQRQRLCIARALASGPTVLLLDEATASVESESERLIHEAIERLMHQCTIIIISHRLSMVRNADQILVIKNGELVEKGKHSELIALNGWYSRMYQIQMEYEPV